MKNNNPKNDRSNFLNSTTKKLFSLAVFLLLVILFIDYKNVFSNLGLTMNNLNFDFISILINNLVIILLFYITYKLIDSKNIQKEKNKRDIALIMLRNTYYSCRDIAQLFENEKIRKIASKKVDGNKVAFEDSYLSHYQNLPFENDNVISDFAKEGILTPEDYDLYIKIQKQYKKYISLSVTLFDNYSLVKPQYEALNVLLDPAIKLIDLETPPVKHANRKI